MTTSCSARNIVLCKSLGADEVIDYNQGDLVATLKAKGQIFDLVVDNIGSSPKDLYSACGDFLVPSGQFVQVGASMLVADIKLMASRMMLLSSTTLACTANLVQTTRSDTRQACFVSPSWAASQAPKLFSKQ